MSQTARIPFSRSRVCLTPRPKGSGKLPVSLDVERFAEANIVYSLEARSLMFVGSGTKVRNHSHAGFDGEREVTLPVLTTVYVPDVF